MNEIENSPSLDRDHVEWCVCHLVYCMTLVMFCMDFVFVCSLGITHCIVFCFTLEG